MPPHLFEFFESRAEEEDTCALHFVEGVEPFLIRDKVRYSLCHLVFLQFVVIIGDMGVYQLTEFEHSPVIVGSPFGAGD